MRALALFALAVPSLLAACASNDAPVFIGAAGPWSDPSMVSTRNGIDLALSQINAQGGVAGHPVRVRYADDHRAGTQAIAVAKAFVDDPAVAAVIGHANSTTMLAAAPVYDGHLVAISTKATSPDITGISRWVFRLIPSDSVNGEALGSFASHLGTSRAAILYENDAYGRGLARAFRRHFQGAIIAEQPIDQQPTTFEPYVSYLRGEHADLVFAVGLTTPGEALLREAKRQHLDARFLGGDAWLGIEHDTTVAEGAYVGVPFAVDSARPQLRQLVAAYTAQYHTAPDEDAVLAYDAARLLTTAMTASGTNRRQIRGYLAALSAIKPYEAAAGPVYFSAGGDPMALPFAIDRVTHGTLIATK
jgi:branched-chain amino acid transport system substrate-binding protein